ncbi:MaoC/PaaZ C-terminal domain-containing protein [Propionicimonas sp.]|uniref:MaoC/PaaZ C-terminal domain-containing protein n=1 Tax=Propionicimonas sp. TaxID=1955623 RepID=UPI0039E2D61E
MSPLAAEVGQVLPGFSRTLTRADLVRYAGASGDFNPIHWSDAAAAALGLPDVIAHGMLTMGTALRVVTDWAGDVARVRSYSVRFTKPVVVAAETGAVVVFGGTITKVEDGVATVAIEATCGEAKVLGAAVAEVDLG